MLRIIAFSWLLTASAGAPQSQVQSRPNFIVFIADDMACDDCGAFGHAGVRTPNLDRLARAGMVFDNAFLTCSSCSPSRCSILTGRYPHATGAHQLHSPLPAGQITFVDVLRRAGYFTAAAGKWHLGNDAIGRFDKVLQGRMSWTGLLSDRPKDKPFCLWLAFADPHRPYQSNAIARPHRPGDAVVPPYLPDNEATRADLAQYYDEITRLDHMLGETLAALEVQGVANETVVIFLSDNGRPFPRCKTTLYDSGIKTPLIVRWPNRVQPATRTSALVSTVDLAPTILKLAGLAAPDSMQGKNFSELLDKPKLIGRRFVYAEHDWHDFDDRQRAVRTSTFKYVRSYYTDIPLTPPADAVRSPTFQSMRAMRDAGQLTVHQLRVFSTPRPHEELYDVRRDPHELYNLAANPAYAEELRTLRQALADWERSTGDQTPQKRREDVFDRETGQPVLNEKRGKG